MAVNPAFHPGAGPQRRQSFRSRTDRDLVSDDGTLGAPSRAHSINSGQGATSAATGGLTFPATDSGGTNWWIDVTLTDIPPGTTPADTWTTAVTAPRRVPLRQVLIDWDRDGYASPYADVSELVEDITVDRAATGDLPAEVSLVEGTTITQATITLGGNISGSGFLDLIAPYRSDSPFYRAPLVTSPVTVDLGLLLGTGPGYERQLTGTIRAVKPDSGTRKVTITALDLADQLRARITLPAHAMFRDDYLSSHHKFFINGQAVIDYVLRRNGIYASTAPHPQAQISCTGHGWLAAEAGRSAVPRGVAAVITNSAWWVPGPFDLLAVRGVWTGNGAYQEFFANGPYSPAAGNGIGIGAWIRAGNDMGHPAGEFRSLFELLPFADNSQMKIRMGIWGDGGLDGSIVTLAGTSGFVQPISTTTTWQYVGLHFQHNSDGTTTIRYRVGGATTFGAITTPVIAGQLNAYLQCTAWTSGTDWCDFQVWYDHNPPSGAWPGETPVLGADIDTGVNYLTHLPDVVNADSWSVITDVVAAEYGLVGFGPGGRFVFTSRDTATRASGFVTETVTADRALLDLVTETSSDSVRNVITTETTSGFLGFDNVVTEAQSATQFNTYPGTTTFTVGLPYGAIGTTTQQLSRVANASWGADVLTGYVAVDAYNPGTEIDPAADISVLFTASGDRQGLITVRNNSPNYVQFSTTGGQPALRVQGFLLELDPTALDQVARPGSIAVYGSRSLAVGSSPWRQLGWAVRPVAVRLLQSLAYPVPVIDQFSAVGNPARQVGDTIRLEDPQGQGTIRAAITKLTRTLNDQGLVDRLTVRPVGPPGMFILGDPELGVLGDPDLYIGP